MIIERPLEIDHVPPRLHSDFDTRLPPGATGVAAEREKNFLSRALAAFAVHRLAGCSLDDAASSVVDGGGDGGIDAIYYSPTSHRLWVVQSKYIEGGRGESALGDVAKFKTGLENLLQGNFVLFEQNEAWRTRLPAVRTHFNDASLEVRAVLVYSGIGLVSEDRLRMFEHLKARFSPDSDYFVFAPYNLTSIHDWITGVDEGLGVKEVELTILKPGWVRSPYETVYGLVTLCDLAALQSQHGRLMVAANIRHYKGATEVNDRILATLREEPHHLFYLNNGITAYCQRFDVNNLDRGDTEKKRIKAYGFSVVNGAQTLGAIENAIKGGTDKAVDGFVFLRLVSLQHCMDDVEFARRITQSTNFQNQIGSRDFVSLDEQQERIARQLQLSGVRYHYKDSEDVPPPDAQNFTLEEATNALACSEQEKHCDLYSRILANRRSLWSFEEIYPNTQLYRSRYARLFRPDRSARTVWRAVQAMRLVKETMQADARASIGVRKTFFENARWLVLNIIFLKLHPHQGEDLTLTADEVDAVRQKTQEYSTALWSVAESQGYVSRRMTASGVDMYEQTRHFRSVFCTATDCERLRNTLLARLEVAVATVTSPPPATHNSPESPSFGTV